MAKKLKIYCYERCGTCRKALAWLNERGIEARTLPIRETPPSPAELKRMLKACDGQLRRLFNTSSADYRELGIKGRLDTMEPAEVFELLRSNGNLVKRPFVLGDGVALVGFKPAEWEAAL